MSRSFSVLIAESNPLLREKMAGMLTRDKNVWCVVQVEEKGGLTRSAAQLQPDYILADFNLVKDQQLLSYLRQSSSNSKIFGLVDFINNSYEKASERLSLDGLFEKGRIVDSFNEMIQTQSGTNRKISDEQ